MNTRLSGSIGEQTAVMYLKKQHYKILDTNFSTRFGEIDIIAKKDNYVVFVEVKTRSGEQFGSPAEAVTKYKQQKIITTAKNYIVQHALIGVCYRFDVIEIFEKKINHIIDAFRIE